MSLGGSPATGDRTSEWSYLILAFAIAAAFALVVQVFTPQAHGGGDENGYLVAGSQIAATGRPEFRPVYQGESPVPPFVGDMWVGRDLGTPQERYLPKYPPGFPLMVAGILKLAPAGSELLLVYMLNPAGYCIGLLGVYVLARILLGTGPAFMAMAAAMVSVPVLRLMSVPCSHGPSFAVTTWAVVCLTDWLRRNSLLSGILAGLLCGAAAAIRSGEVVLVAPLLVAALLHTRDSRRNLWPSVLVIVSWLAVFGATTFAQYRWMGSWSSYSATDESSAFSLQYLWKHVPTTAVHLFSYGVGLLLPLGITGLFMLARRDLKLGLALASWVAANILLYTAYYWAPSNTIAIFGRFFLPSVGILCACGMVAACNLSERRRRLAKLAGWLTVAASAAITLPHVQLHFAYDGEARWSVDRRTQWLQQHVPPDAVLFCDELDILDNLQFVANYTLYDSRMFDKDAVLAMASRDPGSFSALDGERRAYLAKQFAWRSQEQLTALRDDLAASYVSSGRRVFFFSGNGHHWHPFSSLEARGFSVTLIATYQHPVVVPRIPSFWGLEEVTRR